MLQAFSTLNLGQLNEIKLHKKMLQAEDFSASNLYLLNNHNIQLAFTK